MRKVLRFLGERLSYILFVGVLLTGVAIGFSVGYDSGHREASDKAFRQEMVLYKDFLKQAARGSVFSLWGVRLLAPDFKKAYARSSWRNPPRVGGYETEKRFRQFSEMSIPEPN